MFQRVQKLPWRSLSACPTLQVGLQNTRSCAAGLSTTIICEIRGFITVADLEGNCLTFFKTWTFSHTSEDVEGQRYLVDLKSTHGTFLESKRLKPNEPAKWPEGRRVQKFVGNECVWFSFHL